MKTTIKSLARFAAAVALGAATLLPHTGISHAAGARPLVAADFYSIQCCAQYVSANDPKNPVPTIAGTHFNRGMLLGHSNFGSASATFNMARYPGYGVFTAQAGIIDGSATNVAERLNITGDGKLLYSHVFQQGQLAMPIAVSLGKAHAITLEADSAGDDNATGLLLVDPTLRANGTPSTGHPVTAQVSAGKITLQLFSATASAGGQQTALITTAANALVTVILDYPDGEQMAIGPRRAGPDGHFAYTWSLPAGLRGSVHVTVDSAGSIAQGTFTVG